MLSMTCIYASAVIFCTEERKNMRASELNWGQEFIPDFPDSYISEDLPRGNGKCPNCGKKLIRLKGEDRPYCSRCYMEYKEKYGDVVPYSETDRQLALDRLVRQQLDGFVKE